MENSESIGQFEWKDTAILLICMLFGIALAALLTYLLEISSILAILIEKIHYSGIQKGHILLFVSHLGTFIIPAVLFFSWRKELTASLLGPAKCLSSKSFALVAICMVVTLPWVYGLYEWNKWIGIPSWALEWENAGRETLKALLSEVNWTTFVVNLFLIALIPAIGEELIFRGIVQNILVSRIKSIGLGILITAAVFSAIHLQFEGFFPRLWLGMLLGYFYAVTKNILFPILGHFINNGIQLSAYYWLGGHESMLEPDYHPEVSWWAILMSAVATIWLCYMLYLSCLPIHRKS